MYSCVQFCEDQLCTVVCSFVRTSCVQLCTAVYSFVRTSCVQFCEDQLRTVL